MQCEIRCARLLFSKWSTGTRPAVCKALYSVLSNQQCNCYLSYYLSLLMAIIVDRKLGDGGDVNGTGKRS